MAEKDSKHPSGERDVGYGKPPKHTQFKTGRSGNPKGRPSGSKNLKTELIEELSERMPVIENGKRRRVSKLRAVIKSQTARALAGNDRAAAKLLDMYFRAVGVDDDDEGDEPLTQDERAVMEVLRQRLLRQTGSGAEGPEDGGPDDKAGPPAQDGGEGDPA